MRNIEIKFRVTDLAAVEKAVGPLANYGPELLVQQDVYFDAPGGRLKIRTFADRSAELIAYRRTDATTARESCYLKHQTLDPESLQRTLALAVPQSVTVQKKRTLYLIGQTRVHLDQVEGLGDFVELEVVLTEGQTPSDGTQIAGELITALGLEATERVATSYSDLLRKQEVD